MDSIAHLSDGWQVIATALIEVITKDKPEDSNRWQVQRDNAVPNQASNDVWNCGIFSRLFSLHLTREQNNMRNFGYDLTNSFLSKARYIFLKAILRHESVKDIFHALDTVG